MERDLRIPPVGKSALTPAKVLAERLGSLVGQPFALTGRTRTDGSHLRRVVAAVLGEKRLPPGAAPGEFGVVPPRGKGVPRIRREWVDTYIVTSGDSYNLQIWNRFPASDGVLVEYAAGDPLLARDVRIVLVRIDPDAQVVRSVVVLTPEYVVRRFGPFGRPTVKHQMTIGAKTRQKVLAGSPPVLCLPDTPSVRAASGPPVPGAAISDAPQPHALLPIEQLRDRLVGGLLGRTLVQAPTKSRGQALEGLVADVLGFRRGPNAALAGGYPDIRNQALEVKVQDAPTVDLGRFTPAVVEPVPDCMGLTTADIRYLVAFCDISTSSVAGLVLCPGEKLGHLFTYVSDVNWKCQKAIPMSFFDRHDGRAVYNP